MTAQKDLKRIIRERQAKTGEAYATARAHVILERDRRLGVERAEAAVLKVGRDSGRLRLLGDDGQITFRSVDIDKVVPGHTVTVAIEKRWTWRGDAYASGRIESARIDVPALGLTPLPLTGGELVDLRSAYEPYRRPDPYAPLWRKLTAKRRACFELDPIAWGKLPGQEDDADGENNPTCIAADLAQFGDREGARRVLMETLVTDLRCIDAHAHLGNLEFDHSAERALMHYEIGVRITELSLPPGFDGVLPWGRIYNRPFLRCLHGLGLCLWRLGRLGEAEQVFERMLSLNPNDNQGVRACWDDVRNGRAWDDPDDELDVALTRAAKRGSVH